MPFEILIFCSMMLGVTSVSYAVPSTDPQAPIDVLYLKHLKSDVQNSGICFASAMSELADTNEALVIRLSDQLNSALIKCSKSIGVLRMQCTKDTVDSKMKFIFQKFPMADQISMGAPCGYLGADVSTTRPELKN
jgi:hypothetical protein